MLNKAKNISTKPSVLERVWYFFPLQILFLHFKRNHIVLGFWTVLFLFITNVIGYKYGIPYLFLAPEYYGKIDVFSFGILGLAMGGFTMAFNIYSYIIFASEFPFLATFSRPFIKFCYNNILIPLLFIIVYLYFSFKFQHFEELLSIKQTVFNLLSFIFGVVIFIVVTLIYFVSFNKNIYHLSGKDKTYYDEHFKEAVKEATFHKKTAWYYRINLKKNIRIVTYINNLKEIKLARNIAHYDEQLLKKVFVQNHINASIYEILLFVTFIVLGVFRDNPIFNIPAGASIFILFTLALLLYSALFSWFKNWTLSLFIILFLLINYNSSQSESYLLKSFAYGIDYNINSQYSNERLHKMATDSIQINKDRAKTLSILEQWKLKNSKGGKAKPKLIVLNVSGGGLRSALWSFYTTSYLDSICNGNVLKQTQLITGASGGMLGISYLRELYLQKQTDSTLNLMNPIYTQNIAEDLLNPLLFGIATTDFIFKFQQIKEGDFSYGKDRGYSFEEKIISNLDGVFKVRRLKDYRIPELKAQIPMLFLTPTIANDGRRLLISPHSVSYLANDTVTYSNVDYQLLFAKNKPEELKYLSALRMSANFPYILPMVSLPSTPTLKIVDAGIKDNYGLQTSTLFLAEFSDWISKNTSGVVFIEIRDTPKLKRVKNTKNSLYEHLIMPVGNIIGNMLKVQDYNNSELLERTINNYPIAIHHYDLYVEESENQNVSMSWHLTKLDCQKIYQSIKTTHNRKTIMQIKQLLEL